MHTKIVENKHKVPVFWLLPDPHFGHYNIVKNNIRPQGYEEQILTFIKDHVKDNDVLICLGDYIFQNSAYWSDRFIEASNCRKWLTLGNHDHDTITWYLRHGFHAVADEIKLTIYGKVVLLSHIPITGRRDFDINIHAHLHKGQHRKDVPVNSKNINLFIEGHFTLFNLRAIVDRVNLTGYYDCYRHRIR